MKRHLLSALYAATATAAVLVVFNAFFNGTSSENNSASAKLASYLHLDKVKQESAKDEINVAGTENATNAETDANNTASQPESTTGTVASSTPSKIDTTKETIYTVKDGDTYGCIAEKYYGSFEHFVDIMAANPVGDKGFGEYSLFVDAKLVLPAIAKENLKPASNLCQ